MPGSLPPADVILVGAPYWEYQFPALLRCYVEHISVSGLTFAYGEDGRPHGLCKGDRLFYLTTAGRTHSGPELWL